MKIRAVSAVFALTISSQAFSHSAMYDDYFFFDDSDGGHGLSDTELFEISEKKAKVACSNGSAGGYPCSKVDLLAFVSKNNMGGNGSNLNDIWGWTDPETGNEIAIVGRENGTSFVDVTDGVNPVFIGFLSSHNGGSTSWRDIKVYKDHAFIVSELSGEGMQIFDLRTLKNIDPGSTLQETAHFSDFGNAHNIVINEDSGFAYAVGSNRCGRGLNMIDISNPQSPTSVGCFSSDGYTHDAQCVIYNGPDSEHVGKEICVAYNEDTVTIVDVSNKSNPRQLSRTGYSGSEYTHQGWFVDDSHSIIIANDELDEQRQGVNTTSYIFDVSNLDRPVLIDTYVGPTSAIDHNLYVKDGLVYESNYRAGLRILSTEDVENGKLSQVAYFDTIPNSNSASFSGTWSNYPFFASGKVITSDIGNGLFILEPTLDISSPTPISTPTATPTVPPAPTATPIPSTPAPTPSSEPTPSPTPSDGLDDLLGGSMGGGGILVSLLLLLFGRATRKE